MKKSAFFPFILAAAAIVFTLPGISWAQQWTDPIPEATGPVPPIRNPQPCDPGRLLYVERMVQFRGNNAVHLDLMRRAARQHNFSVAAHRTPRDILLDLTTVYYPMHPDGMRVLSRHGSETLRNEYLSVWVEENGVVSSERVCHRDDSGNLVPYPGLVPSALLPHRRLVISFPSFYYGGEFTRPTARFAQERDAHPSSRLVWAMTDVIEVGNAIRHELQRQATIAAGVESRRRAEEVRRQED